MNCLLKIGILVLLFCTCTLNGGRKSHHQKKKVISHVSSSSTSSSSLSLEHSMPWKEISKKSLIEHGIAKDDQHKEKRGFLANLANLLTDAEAISGHGKSDTTAENIVNSYSNINPDKKSIKETNIIPTSASLGATSKREGINPATINDINEVVDESGKEYAPVFAMFHGKVVPLGKLPDTAFKTSHDEEKYITDAGKSTSEQVNQPSKYTKEVSGNKRNLAETTQNPTIEQPFKRDSQIDTTKQLQNYLKTIDVEKSKDTEGTEKDDVPSLDGGLSKNPDLANHIKSILLDNGKVVSVTNHLVADELTSTSKQDSDSQKYYVTNDGNVEPLVKSKTQTVDAVTRDNLFDITNNNNNNNGQKTVTLTVDVLKDLLKRTDSSKVSLANLLNKPAEGKSGTPSEDEDPGTIEDFAAGGLKSHNEYRAKHHDDVLIWSDELAAKAQKLAESLADQKTLEIAKDLEKDGMGENVAKVWATFKNAGDAATKMWYSQSSNYRFDDPHLDENTGQFAQVVWKSTRELGMGVAKSIDDVNNKYVYVTALYRPPGNIEATLRENVLPTGNNTIDVYSTFFKRTGVSKDTNNSRKSRIMKHRSKYRK